MRSPLPPCAPSAPRAPLTRSDPYAIYIGGWCAPRPAASTAPRRRPLHGALTNFPNSNKDTARLRGTKKHCMWIACGGPALGHQPQAVQKCRSGRPSDCSCELRGICSAQPCRAAVGLPGAQSPPTSPRRRTSRRSYRASLSALLSPRSCALNEPRAARRASDRCDNVEAFSNGVLVESLLPPEVLEPLDLRFDGLLGNLECFFVFLACLLAQGLDLFLLELDRLLVD